MEELAGRPAGFGENIRETFWGAKTSARFLASRPAGFGDRPASFFILVANRIRLARL